MRRAEIAARMRKALAPGSVFAGKYRIQKQLGTGSFAHVLLARHEVMGRDVALKVLKPEILEKMPEVSDRFINEARIVSQLRHPNSVTVFDFGEVATVSYMVMEYIEGSPLDEVLERGPMSIDRTCRVLKQILKSLDEAHALGIIHRDLKPGNIMLTELHGESDFVKVLDFGVAKLMGDTDGEPSQTPVRRSTQFIGTPIYMSPEQVLGQEVVPASDLYSLGLIVYEMLTGDQPIEAANVATVAQKHLDDKPLPFKKIKQLPKAFQRLILKATARYPQQRFTSVPEFARAIPGAIDLDHSAEFSKLLAQRAAEANEQESIPEVFSGRGYVEHPEDSDELWTDLGPRRAADPSTPKEAISGEFERPKRPADRTGERERPKPRRSSRPDELEVDYAKVRREDWRRDREQRQTAERVRDSSDGGALRWAIYAASVFVGLLGLQMLGSWVSGHFVVKLALGLSPLLAGYLWITFSPTRRAHGDLHDTFFGPLARAWMASVGVAFLVGLLVFPSYAAGATRLQARWLVGEDGSLSKVLGPVADGVAGLLTAIFEVASGIVPW